MIPINRKLDALQSEEDIRDWNAKKFCGSILLPPIVDNRNKLKTVRDQGNQGACVAFSGACIKEYQERIENKLEQYFSPQFIYNLRGNYPDWGMSPRDLLEILKDVGCVVEDDYYYANTTQGNLSSLRQNQRLLDYAKNFKISGYARIYNIDSLKESIYKNGVCTISVKIYDEFSNEPWTPTTDNPMGFHQMAIVGYNDIDKKLIIRNSWGEGWGDKGYCYMSYEDFDKYNVECWTAIDAQSKIYGRYIYKGQLYKEVWYRMKWFYCNHKTTIKFSFWVLILMSIITVLDKLGVF